MISIATINNKAFEEFTGVKEELLIGMTDFEVFEADIAEAFVKKDLEMIQLNKVINSLKTQSFM